MITNDPTKISEYCLHFYTNLYTSRYSECSADTFLNFLPIKSINPYQKEYCDDIIILEVVVDSIDSLKNNKSPGVDGLTSEFYKTFSEHLAPFLLEVFLESIQEESLPPSLMQGLITLIPKPKKDPLLLENWRPISLLNND